MEKMSHVVCLGGGNAMPRTVLEGLKKHPVKISAISAMLDSGGTAGRERELFKTKVAFGDIRRAALALSGASPKDKERFAYRFENGQVMANTYCTTAVLTDGIEELLIDLREDLKISSNYQFFPATLDDSALCAKLDNGEIITGETNIDIPKHDANLKIKNVFLEPAVNAYPPAIKAIQEADLIVMGPGDLYSSLFQILLVQGIAEAIRKSRAKKIYVCNLMTKRGETDNFSVLDFVFEIERCLRQKIDYVVFNKNKSSALRIANYKKEHPELLELVSFHKALALSKDKFIGENILIDKGPIAHDPDRLAKIILDICPNPLLKQ